MGLCSGFFRSAALHNRVASRWQLPRARFLDEKNFSSSAGFQREIPPQRCPQLSHARDLSCARQLNSLNL
jgi:hypothetical protein